MKHTTFNTAVVQSPSHYTHTHAHTHTQPFYGSVEFVRDNPGEPVPEEMHTHDRFVAPLHVWDYLGELVPEEHAPTHTYLDHQSSFICFLHVLQSMASSLFNLHA